MLLRDIKKLLAELNLVNVKVNIKCVLTMQDDANRYIKAIGTISIDSKPARDFEQQGRVLTGFLFPARPLKKLEQT